VLVVPGKIQQLLLNLMINAQHAVISEGDGGMVSILLSQRGGAVVLSVSDSGKGIEKENLDRIFDPFFSTKGVWGKDAVVGTGLGLAVCRNIAEEHNGKLTVASEIGKGTTFTLTLPAASYESSTDANSNIDMSFTLALLTTDQKVESHYNAISAPAGHRLEIFQNADALSIERLRTISFIVIDGYFPAKIELLQLTMRCEQCECPYVLVNTGARDNVLAEAFANARGTYGSLPPLTELIKTVEQSKLAAI
jgi:hypothetical protein